MNGSLTTTLFWRAFALLLARYAQSLCSCAVAQNVGVPTVAANSAHRISHFLQSSSGNVVANLLADEDGGLAEHVSDRTDRTVKR